MITRAITKELLVCAKEYPAVTILGPRQSGKTTLARMTFPDYSYCSLEDPDTRQQAQDDPRGLLANFNKGVILDEIQKVPQLLSYLQGIIDEKRKPGRFILTGSHQPQVHNIISQSLAGRTAILELYPLSFDELKQYKTKIASPYDWIIKGCYPGLHENNLRPGRFFSSYVSTYVERDIRSLINLTDLTRFEEFLRLLAGRIGQLVNYSALAADVGVSSTTIKNWISVLKASYILFELPPYYANIRKRVTKSSKIYFVDAGLAAWLLGLKEANQVERDPLRGSLYENLLILEVVKKILNQGQQPNLHFFRDSKGNEVDLLIQDTRSFTTIEIKSGQTFQSEYISGIENFKNTISSSFKVKSQVWYNGQKQTMYKDTKICNPILNGFNW
ncbi:MAG: ATP-binding protein [Planctomycetaceae bacterium]|nr:ATP-binding protein [Planctomycetaceae bacterium]